MFSALRRFAKGAIEFLILIIQVVITFFAFSYGFVSCINGFSVIETGGKPNSLDMILTGLSFGVMIAMIKYVWAKHIEDFSNWTSKH